MSVPAEGYFALNAGFNIENQGVNPDETVEYSPAHYLLKKDPQLDRAIEVALSQIDEQYIRPPEMPT